jgi:hypothetical protein
MSSALISPPGDGCGNREDVAEPSQPTSTPMEREKISSVSPQEEKVHELSSQEVPYGALSEHPEAGFDSLAMHPSEFLSNPQIPAHSPQALEVCYSSWFIGNPINYPAAWNGLHPEALITGEIDDCVNLNKMRFENTGFAMNANQFPPADTFDTTEEFTMPSFAAPSDFGSGNGFGNTPFETFDQSENTQG